jgi:signal transduction histidine kinase
MKYHISELIDAEKVQKLMISFREMTHMTCTLTDPEGNVLKVNDNEILSSGWQSICMDFHKKHPITYAKCIESDTILSKQLLMRKKYSLYKCRNGLVDAAIPIYIEQEHVLNLFTGQFFLEPPDLDFFRKQASKYGFNEEKYMIALSEVPVLDKKIVEQGLLFLASLAELIAYMGFKEKELLVLKDNLEKRVETRTLELKKVYAEKMEAIAEAAETKKFALVGQVAGKMAHDFNNILGAIMGNAELSILDCKDVETKKRLELIFEQTLRGRNLTKNLVAFAKDQKPKQIFFKISEKIDLVLNLMKKDMEGIELLKEESPDVPELLADPGMIEHAFVNLIQNSIHALSKVEYPRIIIRTYSRDNHICFEIEDNGCGIPKENMENIYEPSFTLKGSKDITGSYEIGIKGTGYGLANVKKYIEQHKGTISVESESSSGTKFTICLPVINKELTKEEKTEIREEITHFEKYILVVEDETAIADVQYRILTQEPCNHQVDIANNGQVAMDLFERNKYDLVSLDYILPGDINGMTVYRHIRSKDKTIPILFISGNIEFLESIKELKQKDTMIDHLSKPCQNKDYVKSINELFERILVAGP